MIEKKLVKYKYNGTLKYHISTFIVINYYVLIMLLLIKSSLFFSVYFQGDLRPLMCLFHVIWCYCEVPALLMKPC